MSSKMDVESSGGKSPQQTGLERSRSLTDVSNTHHTGLVRDRSHNTVCLQQELGDARGAKRSNGERRTSDGWPLLVLDSSPSSSPTPSPTPSPRTLGIHALCDIEMLSNAYDAAACAPSFRFLFNVQQHSHYPFMTEKEAHETLMVGGTNGICKYWVDDANKKLFIDGQEFDMKRVVNDENRWQLSAWFVKYLLDINSSVWLTLDVSDCLWPGYRMKPVPKNPFGGNSACRNAVDRSKDRHLNVDTIPVRPDQTRVTVKETSVRKKSGKQLHNHISGTFQTICTNPFDDRYGTEIEMLVDLNTSMLSDIMTKIHFADRDDALAILISYMIRSKCKDSKPHRQSAARGIFFGQCASILYDALKDKHPNLLFGYFCGDLMNYFSAMFGANNPEIADRLCHFDLNDLVCAGFHLAGLPTCCTNTGRTSGATAGFEECVNSASSIQFDITDVERHVGFYFDFCGEGGNDRFRRAIAILMAGSLCDFFFLTQSYRGKESGVKDAPKGLYNAKDFHKHGYIVLEDIRCQRVQTFVVVKENGILHTFLQEVELRRWTEEDINSQFPWMAVIMSAFRNLRRK